MKRLQGIDGGHRFFTQCRTRGPCPRYRRGIGHLILKRLPPNSERIGDGLLAFCGIDDELQFAILDHVDHVRAALIDLVDHRAINPGISECLS